MLYDLCFGVLIYIGTSTVFGEPFSSGYLAVALLFSLFPDLDFIPYVLLRKRFQLVTHRFIHYPILFGAMGLILILISPYLGVLFLLCTLAHFVHDTFSDTSVSPLGVQWLYPFSEAGIVFRGGKFLRVSKEECESLLELRRQTWQPAEKRSLWWEVTSRMETMSFSGWVLAIITGALLFWFVAAR